MVDELLPPKAPEMRRLLEPLVRHGVDFVLIGGVAGNAWGSSYPTYDLDVIYARDRSNIVRLVAALEEIGVRLRGAPADLPFQLDAKTIENGSNFTFETPHGDFDTLGDVDGVRSYEELRAQAEKREVWGFTVWIASIDHLIAMKRAANRPKDRNMLEEYLVLADRQRSPHS
jgi:predicted nucleotidyltransferase